MSIVNTTDQTQTQTCNDRIHLKDALCQGSVVGAEVSMAYLFLTKSFKGQQ
jgi:hypothetical protein